jgi:hypothetical protein
MSTDTADDNDIADIDLAAVMAAVLSELRGIRAALGRSPSDDARYVSRAELYRRLDVSEPSGDRLASGGRIGPRPIYSAGVKYYLAGIGGSPRVRSRA